MPDLFPLTFKEFIINSGLNSDVIDYVKNKLNECKPIEKTIHESMRSLYVVIPIAFVCNFKHIGKSTLLQT